MNHFPKAFEQYQEKVDTSNIKNFQQLLYSFKGWAGNKYKDTPKQREALEREARKLGITTITKPRIEKPKITAVVEKSIKIRGEKRTVYRDVKTGRFVRKGTNIRIVTVIKQNIKIRGKPRTIYRDVKTGRFAKKEQYVE